MEVDKNCNSKVIFEITFQKNIIKWMGYFFFLRTERIEHLLVKEAGGKNVQIHPQRVT